jgi:hypothetical protein
VVSGPGRIHALVGDKRELKKRAVHFCEPGVHQDEHEERRSTYGGLSGADEHSRAAVAIQQMFRGWKQRAQLAVAQRVADAGAMQASDGLDGYLALISNISARRFWKVNIGERAVSLQVGLERIVALCYRSSTSYQIH